MQPEFTASVLMEAHARGLTTCIDTTGQGLKHSRECAGGGCCLPAAALHGLECGTCARFLPEPLPELCLLSLLPWRADWDKVLPHLDYALFCIKSPIPGVQVLLLGSRRVQLATCCPTGPSRAAA